MTKDKHARPTEPRPVSAGDRAPDLTEEGIERYVVDGATEGALDTLVNVVRDVLETSKPRRVASPSRSGSNAIVDGTSPDEFGVLRAGDARPGRAVLRQIPMSVDDELVEHWRSGVYPYRNLMSRKAYEAQKYHLQVELLKLQAWVKETGPARRDPLRGSGRGGQGRHDQAVHGAPQPARRARRRAREADAESSRGSGTSSATCSTCRRAARSCSSTGPGTTAPASSGSWASAPTSELAEFLRQAPEFERNLDAQRRAPDQVLVLGEPRGAAPALPRARDATR